MSVIPPAEKKKLDLKKIHPKYMYRNHHNHRPCTDKRTTLAVARLYCSSEHQFCRLLDKEQCHPQTNDTCGSHLSR